MAGSNGAKVLPVVKATHRGSASAHALRGDALRLRTRNRYLVARMHRGVGRIRSLLWEDAKLLLAVGYRVAQAATYPEWKPGNEFKAVRDKMLNR